MPVQDGTRAVSGMSDGVFVAVCCCVVCVCFLQWLLVCLMQCVFVVKCVRCLMCLLPVSDVLVCVCLLHSALLAACASYILSLLRLVFVSTRLCCSLCLLQLVFLVALCFYLDVKIAITSFFFLLWCWCVVVVVLAHGVSGLVVAAECSCSTECAAQIRSIFV